MNKKVYISSNELDYSIDTKKKLIEKFNKRGITVSENKNDVLDLIVCIGGDGTLLDTIHRFNFTSTPIVGINTGTLGFFQEIDADDIDVFIDSFCDKTFKVQPLSIVECIVEDVEGNIKKFEALNEIILRGSNFRVCHLEISIDGSFIENFSGDGVSVASSAGSTAYNYSLNGSIVDPRLNLLQVTPIAPMNTTAFRAFTSSLLLPHDLELEIVPDMTRYKTFSVIADGIDHKMKDIKIIKIKVGEKKVNLYRLESYDFWDKVKNKFLISD
ncbi:MAG: NAD(+)/NADH kinase [Eubacteriales bacterium]|nr:NAD(+)/NADH kinase [Eubacteriales bacterium]MDY3333088.1 NAD(+)/NADH kinase [Gallibacter sp.]